MAKPKNCLLLLLAVCSISTAAVFFIRSAFDSCDSRRDGGAAAAVVSSNRVQLQRQEKNPLDFMRSKRVLLVSHELSLSGGPLLLMELAFLLRGVGAQVVWITNQKSAEMNEVTYSLEHKMLDRGLQGISRRRIGIVAKGARFGCTGNCVRSWRTQSPVGRECWRFESGTQ